MAALMRMSRLVNSSVIGRVLHQSVQAAPKLTAVKYLMTSQPGRQIPAYIARHLSTAQPVAYSQDSTARRSAYFSRDQQLNELYQELDYQWKRYNKISREQIYEALAHSEKEGHLRTTEAFLLLRLCGECLVRHKAEERQKIFNEVLERVEKIVVDPDIAYQNVILRVRLENKDYFEPAQALANIEAMPHVSANRMTYQLMIDSYCLQGDLTGATTILEHIKARNMAVNEQIFHSLITGYMKNNDSEGARSVLDMMRDSNILPTREAYTNLMCGFAEQGNVVEIQKVRGEAEAEGIPLSHRYLFQAIVTLGEYQHEAAFTELLQEVAAKYGTFKYYNAYAMTAAFKLAAAGRPDCAIEVYKSMTVFPQDGFKERSCSKLMEALVIQDQSDEVILDSMAKLEQAGYHVDRQYVIYIAIKHEKDGLANKLYDDFIKVGERIEQGTINNILKIRQANKDVDGILELIKNHWDFMLRLSVNDIVLRTNRSFHEMGLSPEDIYSRMMEKGFHADMIQQYKVLKLIIDGDFDEAEKCLDEFDRRAFIPVTLKLLTNSIHKVEPDRFIQFLFLFEERLDSSSLFMNIASSSLHKIIQPNSVTGEKAVEYVQHFINKGVRSDQGNIDRICNTLSQKNVDKVLIQDLSSKLMQTESGESDLRIWSPEKVQEMCDKYEQNPDSIPSNLHNKVSIILLRKYMEQGNVEKAEPLLSKLRGAGFHFRGRDLMKLFFYNMDFKNDVNSALECRDRIVEERGSQPSTISLAMANYHILNNDNARAVEELKKTLITEDNRTFHTRKISDLLTNVQERCPEKVEVFKNVLFEQNYASKDSNEILIPIMREALASGDSDKVLETCEMMNKDLGKIPMFPEVLQFYIGSEDADRLQKVVDMLSLWRGEDEVLHHLIIAFIACNKVRQAQRITEDPGFKATSAMLLRLQRFFGADMKPALLEQYAGVLKEATQNERDHVLFWLIKQYATFKQPRQALDVLAKYEEEGVIPRGRTLRYLASVLKSYQMDVPFHVPQVTNNIPGDAIQVKSTSHIIRPSTPVKSTVMNVTETEQEFAKSADSDSSPADILAEVKQKVQEGHLNTESLGNIIQLLGEQRNLLGKNILEYMAEQGDTEGLLALRPQVKTSSHALFHGCLFKAYANCGRGEDFLQLLNDDFEGYKSCLTTATLYHLGSKHPDLFQNLTAIILQKHSETPSNYKSVNLLFGASCHLNKFQEAAELLERYPDLKDNNKLIVRDWLPRGTKFYSENPNEMFQSLGNMLGDSVPGRIACTRWLYYNVQTKDIKGVLNVLDYIKNKDMKYGIVGSDILSRTQKILEENNTAVPWTPEEFAESQSEKKVGLASL